MDALAHPRTVTGSGSRPADTPPAAIEIRDLGKRFGRLAAIQGVSFTVPADSIVSILGPSGCGKSTTLRMIAGLEHADEGEVLLNGEVVSRASPPLSTPPEARNIGFVFQSYALWPHLSVFEHVAYPLKARRTRGDIAERVASVLKLVGLGGFERRYPSELSGGQQQRVALARALAPQPPILLLDEPFSNLDAELKLKLRADLQELQNQLKLAIVCVTHDKNDALSLSTRIVVMDGGRVVEIGTPQQMYEHPRHLQTASLMRGGNLFPGAVRSATADSFAVAVDGGDLVLSVPRSASSPALAAGDRVWLSVKSEEVRLADAASGQVAGAIATTSYLGHHTEVVVAAPFGRIRLRTSSFVPVRLGEHVHLAIEPSGISLLPAEGQGPEGQGADR